MKVEVHPFNPEWKMQYHSESELIQKTCGDKILTIEHGGSTAIEGISAKPVIDIYVGTKNVKDTDSLKEPLSQLGYEFKPTAFPEHPTHRYFSKDINGKRTFQIHADNASADFHRNDLMFKDYIKLNEKARDEYVNLKRELAEKDWGDKTKYSYSKTDFITKIKKEALEYFSKLYESTESEATYLMHKYADEQSRNTAKFSLLRKGELTAIRTDVFPGFSLNRALGITEVNEKFLNHIEEFYKGRTGKFALQIPPNVLDDDKIALINTKGYTYANSWVTFFRDSSPIESKGTDLEVREIGKKYSREFAVMLNDIFGFPHEFDCVALSPIGEKEWVTFMAFDENKPVGSASVCIVKDNAYLAFANVLPEYRKLGIQGELMKRRIDAAKERGAKWVTVDTAETSEEHPNPSYWNMLRYGFRLLYNRPNYVKIL